ncbi:MAG: HDOD domain-containing protein [Gemmatimonadetes bacterium]|nr:HDOD domain-containing protein [Gemmatimonadota bacterium]
MTAFRVLFVDDEERVLSGLRRMLEPHRNEISCHFVTTGAEALECLERECFDAIVSDMQMPGMDGATLLKIAQARHPGVVRLVLSAHTELEATMRSVSVSHQFLTKPCRPQHLLETIRRTYALQKLMENEALAATVGEISSLPSLPRIYNELTQELAKRDYSVDSVSRIVEQDIGMVAQVLHLVNSAYFGMPRRITSMREAIGYIGVETINNLTLSIELFQSFDGADDSGYSIDREQEHNFLVAKLAKRIAPGSVSKDDAYLAGMLHDVGRLILATKYPKQYGEVTADVAAGGAGRREHEMLLFGATHAQVGAYLLGLWNLPYVIVEAVAYHEDPSQGLASDFGLTHAVWIADVLANGETGDAFPESGLAMLDELGVRDRLADWMKIRDELMETSEQNV